jgi:hypothetical protein
MPPLLSMLLRFGIGPASDGGGGERRSRARVVVTAVGCLTAQRAPANMMLIYVARVASRSAVCDSARTRRARDAWYTYGTQRKRGRQWGCAAWNRVISRDRPSHHNPGPRECGQLSTVRHTCPAPVLCCVSLGPVFQVSALVSSATRWDSVPHQGGRQRSACTRLNRAGAPGGLRPPGP